MYTVTDMLLPLPIKKIIGVAFLVILGVLSFFFRDNVSSWLAFNDSAPPIIVDTINEPKSSPPPGSVVPPLSGKVPPPSRIVAPSGVVYTGRDPEEVRPVPEEVKLFSEDQKHNIYRAIGNHGAAVKENPDYFNGWLQLGLLKKVIGDYIGARDAWEYAGVIRPQNSISFSNLGELYWRYLPDFPRAEQNFRIAVANNPMDVMIYISWSDLYRYSYGEKFNLADDVLIQGLAVSPDHVDLLKTLARVYEAQKDYARAIETWERVLVGEPNNTDVAAVLTALKQRSVK